MIRRAFLLAAAPEPPAKGKPARGWTAYFGDPRSAVLFFLASALVIGGGRRVLMGMRARRSVEALEGPNPSVKDIEGAADHGRAALIELFRLLGSADKPQVRDAAGRALAALWGKDELIAEEEKAVVRRGYVATFRARRRYPRALAVPIPIEVTYGVPFLSQGGPGVTAMNLEWSHRFLGTERAGLEQFTKWNPGPGHASFAIDPRDFESNGPHRLAIHSRVRSVGLTESWELDLPHIPFSVEFDPILDLGALLTLPDESRGMAMARSVKLEADAEGESPFLDLNATMTLRNPPDLVVSARPADLAHRVAIEIEGVEGTFPAGSVVATSELTGIVAIRLGSIVGLPDDAVTRPGDVRLRAILTADPDLGWANPDVRSIWPGTITTEWATVRIMRR